jgi:membrane-associated phospholipid phosphatase
MAPRRGKLSTSLRLQLILFVAGFSASVPASAQEAEALPSVGNAAASRQAPSGVLGALGTEAKLYLDDGAALLAAPFHWNGGDRALAGGTIVLVGGLMIFDGGLSRESQERRSAFTDRISKATTGFGSGDAFLVAGGLVVSGFAFRDQRLNLMGREAIEASVFSGLLESALKPAFGRVRPGGSASGTTFEPGSSNYSFPSGHSTEAFAVASVIAARSSGWVVPVIAYAGAALVAFDRVNDHAHFPSDVVAGAAIGTAVGRFIVHRHENAAETPRAEISLRAIPHGLGLVARF